MIEEECIESGIHLFRSAKNVNQPAAFATKPREEGSLSDCPSDSNLSCSSITSPLSALCDAQLEPFRHRRQPIEQRRIFPAVVAEGEGSPSFARAVGRDNG